MKRYLVLYHSSVSASEQMQVTDPAKAQAARAAWMSWTSQNAAALVDLGSPIGETCMLRGPSLRAGHINGYGVIQAESLQAAKEMFQQHPHFQAPHGDVELLELTPMVRRSDVPTGREGLSKSTTVQFE